MGLGRAHKVRETFLKIQMAYFHKTSTKIFKRFLVAIYHGWIIPMMVISI